MTLSTAIKEELEKEAARIAEDALYSGKAHYNATRPWRIWHRVLGIISAAGSAIAGIAVLKQWAPEIAIGATFIATISSVIFTTLKPNDEAACHQRAADRYFAVKNRVRIFRNIDLHLSVLTEEKLVSDLKALSFELDDIRFNARPVPRKAYLEAKVEVEEKGAATYEVDKKDKS